MKDLKYLLAYLVPLSTALALYWQGAYAWLTPAWVFVLVPLIELFLLGTTENVAPEAEPERSKKRFFDWLLYLNAPIIFGLAGWYLSLVGNGVLNWSETLGLTLSVGITLGSAGINVAHELGHRSKRSEQVLAQIMLLPSLYQHFFIEHNRGHHKNVATDLDPATSRRGEWVYSFWFRSIAGGWRNAWAIERDDLQRANQPVMGLHNRMLRFQIFQLLWLAGVGVVWGWSAIPAAIAIAFVSVLLLETVNYIEHYGLRRRQLDSGRYEPVSPAHSWNSDHTIGRILLYELTRHSDHHYKATRKYQILRHMDESPQLPYGYPASIVLSLLPPLWFRHMDKRLGEW